MESSLFLGNDIPRPDILPMVFLDHHHHHPHHLIHPPLHLVCILLLLPIGRFPTNNDLFLFLLFNNLVLVLVRRLCGECLMMVEMLLQRMRFGEVLGR